jgi:hypothetical protein
MKRDNLAKMCRAPCRGVVEVLAQDCEGYTIACPLHYRSGILHRIFLQVDAA